MFGITNLTVTLEEIKMALPTVEPKVEVEMHPLQVLGETSDPAPVETTMESVSSQEGAVEHSPTPIALHPSSLAANPMQVLADQGITDVVLDFTSFPKIKLVKGIFSAPDFPNFGGAFKFKFLQMRNSYLYSGAPENSRDEEEEGEVAYSDDDATETSTGRLISEVVAEWKEKGLTVKRGVYQIILAICLTAPLEDRMVFLQISPKSKGSVGGFLHEMGRKGKVITDLTILATYGKEIGSGRKAFTPWVFTDVTDQA